MKKYILPLILILFLIFTLIGDCAWLAGWDYRIELAIGDYAGDIGGAVTWFPVEVFFTSTQGEEIFVELTTDAEYKKIQFTQSDGTSLLYGHMKLFDVSEEKGIFTVSTTGWTINANTSVYAYYDKDHADNDTYIGATNTAACEDVYNAEYVAVYPMDDGVDNEHIYDATDNNNDGTKTGAGEPAEAAGKVGQGQGFDGIDDKISADGVIADVDLTTTGNVTISGCYKRTAASGDSYQGFCVDGNWDNFFEIGFDNTSVFTRMRGAGGGKLPDVTDSTDYSGSWVFVCVVKTGDDIELFINGVSKGADTTTGLDGNITVTSFDIGWMYHDQYTFTGLVDEVCTSSTNRSAAWIKGTYNSLWDGLLTYGSEETEVAEDNAILFGMNF